VTIKSDANIIPFEKWQIFSKGVKAYIPEGSSEIILLN
jgi:hypothetical protein